MSTLVRIPDNVTFAEAAVATDSVATAYHAVRTAGSVRAGQHGRCHRSRRPRPQRRTDRQSARARPCTGSTSTRPPTARRSEAGATACFQDARELAAKHPDVIVDFAGVPTRRPRPPWRACAPEAVWCSSGSAPPSPPIPVASLVMRNVQARRLPRREQGRTARGVRPHRERGAEAGGAGGSLRRTPGGDGPVGPRRSPGPPLHPAARRPAGGGGDRLSEVPRGEGPMTNRRCRGPQKGVRRGVPE